MEIDRESLQLVLLQILGVLLIIVGFTMIAGRVRGDSPERALAGMDRCNRKQVEVRVMEMPPPPPAPKMAF